MQHDYWHLRWKEERTGFHLKSTNSIIEKHLEQLELNSGDKIFVPLCGKSLDLIYLKNRKLDVLANEISPIAVSDFFKENDISYKQHKNSESALYTSTNIDVINGDFFSLTKQQLSSVNAVYDRASLVALPKEMRESYCKHLIETLPKKVKILLVTLEYDQSAKQGPPFSVSESEVHLHYEKHFSITLLEIIQPEKTSADNHRPAITEKVYLLES